MIDEEVYILNPSAVVFAATTRIDRWVKIEGGAGVKIGEHVHVASFCHLNAGGGRVTLHDHCGLASGVRVVGGMPDLAHRHISAAEPEENKHPIRRHTIIGPWAIIFSNAVICPGVYVGEGAVIGAGAVVTRDVPPWEVWAGVPARRIGDRDTETGDEYVNVLAGLAGQDRETVQRGIREGYGMEVTERYAADFVSWIDAIVAGREASPI